jgi:arylsulfatase A-like enzyme
LPSDPERCTAPNILLIMTDQQRADFTAAGGFALDTMPFVDSLAARGTAFSGAYTSYPACVPARTSLLTGRFPTVHRVRQNSTPGAATFAADMLDVLRGAGYSTHFVGKPHVYRGPEDFDSFRGPFMHTTGPEEGRSEEDAAFDAWLAGLDHGVHPEPTPFPLERQLPYRIASGAIEAIEEADPERPMFLWASFPEPHNPYQVPEPYFSLFAEDEVPDRVAGPDAIPRKSEKYRWLRTLIEEKRPGYDDGWRRYRANYLGMLRLLDDQIRRLVEHLGPRADNTVVVFLADHGDYVGEYGLQRKGAGMPECLMRIPLQFTGPGVAAQPRRDELVSMVDVLPTLCALAGAQVPEGVQGRSLAPLLAGQDPPPGEFDSIYAELGYGGVPYGVDERPPLHFPYEGASFDELNSVTHSGGQRMVRLGRHKLLMDGEGRGELYDLDADPAELSDRFDDPECAAVRDALLVRLVRWTVRVADDLPTGAYRPKTVPHNWRWAAPAHPSTTRPSTTTGSRELS